MILADVSSILLFGNTILILSYTPTQSRERELNPHFPLSDSLNITSSIFMV